MKLIVGLGNPGSKYENTWHNVGFLAVDQIQKNGFSSWKGNKKHNVNGAEGEINGEKVILIKPVTFMNNSGQAVSAVANFYKIEPKDVIVIHDELDLNLGVVRISQNSSAAGHNGIKSIIQYLNSKEFVRIRVGIKPEKELKMPVDKYVLKKIGFKDKMNVRKIIKDLVPEIVESFIDEGLEKTQNKFN